MVEAEQMQNGRVEIVDMDLILDDFRGVIIGFPVHQTAFDTGAREPGRIGAVLVTAPFRTIGEGRAAKFRGPNDERVRQQTARLQVPEQASNRFIHVPRERFVRFHVAVRVPVVG